MPVSSAVPAVPVAPAVSRASLQKAQADAKQAVVDFRQQAVQERQGVKAALKDVRTALAEIGRYVNGARDQAGHLEVRQALARDLMSIRNLDANAPLRLKGERLKLLESSSIWKQCVGYGKGARTAQAAALAERHGVDLAAPGGRVTRADLQAAQQRAVNSDVDVAKQAFDKTRSALRPILLDALAFQSPARPSAGDASATVPGVDAEMDRLHDKLREGVASAPHDVPLADAYALLRAPLMKAVDSRLAAARAELDGQLEQARHALSAFDRQARIAARAPALAGLVASGSAQRKRESVALEKKLDALMGDWAFGTVFHTNKGCRAVQEMCRGERSALNGKTVKAEIEARLGDDTFTRGERAKGARLVAYADGLDPHTVTSIATAHRQLALIRHAEGGDVETTHRQATHTPATVNMLAGMAGTRQLLRPQQFLSTATRVEDTLAYPVTASAGSEKVKFVIHGFSGLSLGSSYRFAGEGAERVYTQQSAFHVAAMKREKGAYVVTLHEVPVAPAVLQTARVLTC